MKMAQPAGRGRRRTHMYQKLTTLAVATTVLVGVAHVGTAKQSPSEAHPDIQLFFTAIAQKEEDKAKKALEEIAAGWRDGYAGMFWDLVRFMEPPAQFRPPAFRDPTADRVPFAPVEPQSPLTRVWRRLMEFLENQTGERFRMDIRRLQQWIWEQPYSPHPDYAFFKGVWYGNIDPGMRDFFRPGAKSTIRLDEIVWGGVQINGIPPLKYPEHVDADAADYLDDDHIVFGIVINREARAYPKRILAWHEMALDTIGGLELTIVYCTLCGTVIPYESVVDGRHITFGTSGFLYRSNKLMFDNATKSLWNTFEGVPVVGPLVNSGVRLRHLSVVTTTWKEWREKHPDTTVLSLETGHERDYREGAAYRDYFATDDLMFAVPLTDDRLKTKDEVVVTLLDGEDGVRHPLAIHVEFLEEKRLYQGEHAGYQLVVVTSEAGANRVYDAGGVRFARQLEDDRVADATGAVWAVEENALVAESDTTRRLPRVAAQRAFWFGWYAQFPETVLVTK